MEKYINKQITRITKNTNSELKAHTQEIIDDLEDICEFESYLWGDCDNMVNTVNYDANDEKGSLYLYTYTFSPLETTKGDAVKVSLMKIRVSHLQLAKDWMVVSKVKTSFLKAKMSQEIQYVPKKGLEMDSIINAIAIAMAPCVLGLVKLPDRFMTVLDTLLKEQMANPSAGVITSPTSEQTAALYEKFKEMQAKQDEYGSSAQDGISDIVSALGSKTSSSNISAE
jgi:hypothetical protein